VIINLFDGVEHTFQQDPAIVSGLQAFLDQVWRNRPLFIEEEDRRTSSQPFLTFGNGMIKARNYVGFIQYNDLHINIYPRVFHNADSFTPGLAIRHVLKWLSYSSRIHFPLSEADLGPATLDDWLESFIFLFARLTKNLVNTNPHFAYEEIMEELSFVRGRIAMGEYTRQNLATSRWHKIHCIHNPFIYDNLFNRVIKYTARLLLNHTRDKRNIELLSDILFTLDEVSDVPCTGMDCDKIQVSRLYPDMDKVRELCRIFLHHQHIQLPEGLSVNLCMLLPMELIFEQYIAGFLESHFPEYRSRSQAADKYLAETKDLRAAPVFLMKHDILLPGRWVIDTKYKFRIQDDSDKFGIHQGDMYQMLAYCLKRNMQKGMLLYPAHSSIDAVNNIQSYKIDADAFSAAIHAVSIDITETDLHKFDQLQKEKFIQVMKIE